MVKHTIFHSYSGLLAGFIKNLKDPGKTLILLTIFDDIK
jgi:hypothetical protein